MNPSQRGTKDEAISVVAVGASVLIHVFSCVYMYVCLVFICINTGETFSFLLPAGPGGLELQQPPPLCQPSLTVSLGGDLGDLLPKGKRDYRRVMTMRKGLWYAAHMEENQGNKGKIPAEECLT